MYTCIHRCMSVYLCTCIPITNSNLIYINIESVCVTIYLSGGAGCTVMYEMHSSLTRSSNFDYTCDYICHLIQLHSWKGAFIASGVGKRRLLVAALTAWQHNVWQTPDTLIRSINTTHTLTHTLLQTLIHILTHVLTLLHTHSHTHAHNNYSTAHCPMIGSSIKINQINL